MRIVVYGSPGPQGSKRFMGLKSGRGVFIESSKKVRPWREAVKHAALDARAGESPIDAPIEVRMVFTFNRPRGHYRTGRNSHVLRPDAPAQPCVPPDVSKLARSTEDALTDAGIWKDDARIVDYTRLAKVYANEDAEALECPGVVIVIERKSA